MPKSSSVLDRIVSFGKKIPKNRVLPKHIAITAEGTLQWIKNNKIIDVKDAFTKKIEIAKEIISLQTKRAIPILTIYLLDEKKHSDAELEAMQEFFKNIKKSRIVHENKIKISVLGKWYDLPGYLVEEIKQTIDETKSYDCFFLNLCLNYNGHEEITDSCRLIARKIKAGKIDIEDINSELIKDNLYSSYFLPPDLIIKTGARKCWSNLLLWDSADAYYYYAGKLFNDFTVSDFDKALEEFN